MDGRAFTLIELLVVIAIIAVLMAILMPSLHLARDQAYGIICVNNLRALTRAWYLYKDDYDDKLVGGHVGGRYGGELIDWVDSPTGNNPDELEQKKEGIRQGLMWTYIKEMDCFRCPADERKIRPPHWAFRSYSISGNMFGEERYQNWSERALWTYAEIENPADKVVFVEEIDPRGYNKGSWVMNPAGSSWIDPLAIWHNDRSCMSFADGRAEKHRWQNPSTIDLAQRAADGDTSAFNMTPPADERDDLLYMHKRYQLWPSKRRYPP